MKTDTIFYRLFQSFPSIFFELIQRVRNELTSDQKPEELLQLIETVLVYKLPRLSRREVEAMFSLADATPRRSTAQGNAHQADELKQTRYFQDVLEEGREEGLQEGRQEGLLEGRLDKALETVPRLLALGLTVEEVAEALQLDIEQVRNIQKKEGV